MTYVLPFPIGFTWVHPKTSVCFAPMTALALVFTHAMDDFDYGLRAQRAGVPVYVAPGTFGTCSRNAPEGVGQGRKLSFPERCRKARGIKEIPPREWRAMTRRHGGCFWPLFWALPYIRAMLGMESIGRTTARGSS